MAYLKPPFFVQRIFNPLAMRFGIGGAETLTIAGRRSGERRSVPVVPVEVDGSRYIVSARGESDWVCNLRAANGVLELGRASAAERLQATAVPVDQRPPIIEAYRQKAGSSVAAYFKSLPDAADHPVFRLEARSP